MHKLFILIITVSSIHASTLHKPTYIRQIPVYVNSRTGMGTFLFSSFSIIKTKFKVNNRYTFNIEYCHGGGKYATLYILKKRRQPLTENPWRFREYTESNDFRASPQHIETAFYEALKTFHNYHSHKEFITSIQKKIQELDPNA